ncbi:sigma-70 family RNA polymerase sigma factor [Acinetobacter sp. B10A]|nr:sigma-70 family RNA polymerase sigma factor [Acinetobacter baretiae]
MALILVLDFFNFISTVQEQLKFIALNANNYHLLYYCLIQIVKRAYRHMKNSSLHLEENDERQIFIKIYEENYQWLNRWLLKSLKSNLHLDDLVQDTFLKLFISKKAHLIREPKAYLATTARRLFIDRTRHEIIERKYRDYLQEYADEYIDYSPEEILCHLQLLDQVAMAISDLPERQRVSFLLYYLEGVKQSDIAVRFNVSTRTIQNDLVKAMVQCHLCIQQDYSS